VIDMPSTAVSPPNRMVTPRASTTGKGALAVTGLAVSCICKIFDQRYLIELYTLPNCK
jgi:hypothetical protein